MSERIYSTSHRPAFHAGLLHPRYWADWLLLAGCWILAWMPLGVIRLLARALTPVVMITARKHRHIAYSNLAACFLDRSAAAIDELLRGHFQVLVHGFLLYGRLMFASASRLRTLVRVTGLQAVEDLAAAGHGIILLVPHTATFELAAQRITLDHPIVSIARIHVDDAALDWLVSRYRNRFGAVFFDNRRSLVPLIKAVREGRWMYYLPDEDRRDEGGEFAPFYGIAKLTIPTLGRLARASRAKVIPVTTRLDPDTSRITVELGAALTVVPADDPVAESRLVNRIVEEIVDADPRQYDWTTRFFRTRPKGTPPLYG